MKALYKKGSFVVRSMIWSLLLYAALMAVFNWEDISARLSGRSTVHVVNNAEPATFPATDRGKTIPVDISAPQMDIGPLQRIVEFVSAISK